jgi:hypothetical protein
LNLFFNFENNATGNKTTGIFAGILVAVYIGLDFIFNRGQITYLIISIAFWPFGLQVVVAVEAVEMMEEALVAWVVAHPAAEVHLGVGRNQLFWDCRQLCVLKANLNTVPLLTYMIII